MNGHDNKGDKIRTDLLPPRAILRTAEAMTFGADGYGERNWENGMVYGSLIGAAERHIIDWKSGVDIDPKSGKPHLAHATASLLMLQEMIECGVGTDDRSKMRPVTRIEFPLSRATREAAREAQRESA